MSAMDRNRTGALKALIASLALLLALLPSIPAAQAASTTTASPFETLLGWWIGNGRLGFSGGKTETVKCRATYQLGEDAHDVKQTVRCASPSGKVEILSDIRDDNGALTGTWVERTYNLAGELSGAVIPGGFRVRVAGQDLSANMSVYVRGDRQIVEVQFHNSTLIGLTLVFNRGN